MKPSPPSRETTGPIIRRSKKGWRYECKTGRVRGQLTEQVMAVARLGKPFTRRDISADQARADQIHNRLWMLKRQGILKVVRRGINGPHGQPTIYQLASLQRGGREIRSS